MSSLKAARSRPTELADDSPDDDFTSLVVASPGGVLAGEVVLITKEGQISVDYPENPLGPILARTIVENLHVGAKVLLVFERGRRALPVILGVLHDRIRTEGQTIHLQANRIVLEAQEELVMRCGEASFAARRDGRVNVKGKDVVSRASRTNKVRGATVLIN